MLPHGSLGQGQLVGRGRVLAGGGLQGSSLRFYVLLPRQNHFVNTADPKRVHSLTLQQLLLSWVRKLKALQNMSCRIWRSFPIG